MKKLIILISILIVLGLGYYLLSPLWRVVETDQASPLESAEFKKAMEEMEDVVIETSEDMPSSPELIAESNFIASAHDVEGKALLIQDQDSKTLRFEDFNTVNGPNLHIYLSADLEANDFIDIGEIKATKGNVNYDISPSINTQKYNKVLVWCVPFGVLFSYAELN